MIHANTTALDLLRQSLSQFTDAPYEAIVPDAALADLQVDSLTLAELLFELEDRLAVTMPEPAERPQTVGDLLRLVEPLLDVVRSALPARAAA